MLKKGIKRILEILSGILNKNTKINIDNLLILNSKILEELNKNKTNLPIEKYEFKAFSQFGEDGIISYLINNLEIKNKTFIELGVEDYEESNTRLLMMKENWRGLIVDCDKKSINHIKSSNYYWKYDLNAINEFITSENINEILTKNIPNKSTHVGLLSIDLDGNDYHVFNSINKITADILIMEYNSIYGAKEKVTIPYYPDFYRYNYSETGSYFGASISALIDIAEKKGYKYIGTNSAGNNAFFVLKEHTPNLKILYKEPNIAKFRLPTKNKKRPLLKSSECLNEIEHLKLIDLKDGEKKIIKEIFNKK